METRYLTNERGERVGIAMDLEEFERVADSHRAMSEAVEAIQETVQRLAKYTEVEEALRIVEQARKKIEDASRRVTEAQRALDEAYERLEDEDASAALERDLAKIEAGDAELMSWEESKARRRSKDRNSG